MQSVIKLLLSLVVLALAARQAELYYNIVVIGNYMANADIGSTIATVVAWPAAVAALVWFALRAIYKFDPKSI